MELKRVLAGWNRICPGCNIARKYPDSLVGRKVRAHWENGCAAHNAYVEVYGADEPTPKKGSKKKSAAKAKPAAAKKANPGKGRKAASKETAAKKKKKR